MFSTLEFSGFHNQSPLLIMIRSTLNHHKQRREFNWKNIISIAPFHWWDPLTMFISISVARAKTMALCMINYVRRANFTCPPSFVCKKNSSHLLSSFVGILFNSPALEFIYAKLRNFMISIRSFVAKFARRSDVNMHEGQRNHLLLKGKRKKTF